MSSNIDREQTKETVKITSTLTNLGRAVAYYPGLARLLGDVKAALLLCQLLWHWQYWAGESKEWFWKTVEELEWETGLSYKEQRRAREILVKKGILCERPDRLEHKIYFRVDTKQLTKLWSEASKAQCFPQLPKGQFGNAQRSFGERPKGSSGMPKGQFDIYIDSGEDSKIDPERESGPEPPAAASLAPLRDSDQGQGQDSSGQVGGADSMPALRIPQREEAKGNPSGGGQGGTGPAPAFPGENRESAVPAPARGQGPGLPGDPVAAPAAPASPANPDPAVPAPGPAGSRPASPACRNAAARRESGPKPASRPTPGPAPAPRERLVCLRDKPISARLFARLHRRLGERRLGKKGILASLNPLNAQDEDYAGKLLACFLPGITFRESFRLVKSFSHIWQEKRDVYLSALEKSGSQWRGGLEDIRKKARPASEPVTAGEPARATAYNPTMDDIERAVKIVRLFATGRIEFHGAMADDKEALARLFASAGWSKSRIMASLENYFWNVQRPESPFTFVLDIARYIAHAEKTGLPKPNAREAEIAFGGIKTCSSARSPQEAAPRGSLRPPNPAV